MALKPRVLTRRSVVYVWSWLATVVALTVLLSFTVLAGHSFRRWFPLSVMIFGCALALFNAIRATRRFREQTIGSVTAGSEHRTPSA